MLKQVFRTVKITIKYATMPALLKIGLYVIAAVMSTLSIVFTQGLINNLSTSPDVKGVVTYLILLLTATMLISVNGTLGSIINILLKRSLLKNLAEDILKKFHSIRYDCYDDMELYNIISKMGQNPENKLLEAFDGTLNCGRSLIAVAGSIVVFSQMGTVFTLIYIVMLMPLFLFNSRFCNIMDELFKFQTVDERQMNYCMSLLLDKKSVLELKVFDCMDFVLGKWRNFQKKVLSMRVRTTIKGQKYMIFSKIVFMLWVIFLLFILIYRAQRGTITIGLCSVLLLATQTAITNVEDFIWNLGGINESLLFVEYFQKFMGLPERKTISFFKEDFNEIRLENISFKYPNSDKPALKDINMTIKNNRHIAIVGENGSGKSTLVKLLCGLYAPDCGEITINGVNICTLDLTSLRSRIAVVSQDNNLFCPTIRSNILYPNIICKEDVLKTTMHILQLDELVDRKGYDNEVGEDGKLLSGGERQRIQLANALLKNADIILLDEFTSALDVQTERIINDYIFSLKNKIVIIITHRTYMINGLDYVYCFNEGKIIEEGEPKNLLNNKNGFLHKLNMNTDY